MSLFSPMSSAQNSSSPEDEDEQEARRWSIFDYVMMSLYLFTCLCCLIVLFNTTRDRTSRGWKLRFAFLGFLVLQSFGRSVYFATQSSDGEILELATYILIPDFLFFTCFSILLAYWAVVYFTATGRSVYNRRVYWVCLLGNLFYTVCGIVLFVFLDTDSVQRGTASSILVYGVASCSFVIAFGFAFLGFKLFMLFSRLQTGRKSEIVGKVAFISVSCLVCFLYKGVYVCLIPIFSQGNVYRLGSYLIVGEISPALLMAIAFNYFPARWQSTLADVFHPFLGRAYGAISRNQSAESGSRIWASPAGMVGGDRSRVSTRRGWRGWRRARWQTRQQVCFHVKVRDERMRRKRHQE